jgi:BASS family bile acid:Na+ symporter
MNFNINLITFAHITKLTKLNLIINTMEASFLSTVLLPVALAVIMLGLGLSLTPGDFTRIFQRPKAMFVGSFTQLVLLPILGFVIAAIMLADSPELAVGLIILAMCPGGPTSNLIAHLADGDTALCLSLTAISSIIKIFTIPIMVNIAIQQYMGESQVFQLEVVSSIVKIFAITIVPASIGMLIKAFAGKFALAAQKPVKLLSALFLVLVIVGTVYQERDGIVDFFKVAGPATLVLNLAGMSLGYFIPQLLNLNLKQRITISVETSIQNGTLAIGIASSPLMLNNSTMAIPAAVYSLIMFVTAGIFIAIVKNKAKSEIAE